jgi:hypothetical protein
MLSRNDGTYYQSGGRITQTPLEELIRRKKNGFASGNIDMILDAISAKDLDGEARTSYIRLSLLVKNAVAEASLLAQSEYVAGGLLKPTEENWDALRRAVERNHVEAAKTLIKHCNLDLRHQFNLDTYDAIDATLLHIAGA